MFAMSISSFFIVCQNRSGCSEPSAPQKTWIVPTMWRPFCSKHSVCRVYSPPLNCSRLVRDPRKFCSLFSLPFFVVFRFSDVEATFMGPGHLRCSWVAGDIECCVAVWFERHTAILILLLLLLLLEYNYCVVWFLASVECGIPLFHYCSLSCLIKQLLWKSNFTVPYNDFWRQLSVGFRCSTIVLCLV